ncbi:MAG: adenylate/guanylate cyclase domain-containing protein [Geminicoccaceae bacterium]
MSGALILVVDDEPDLELLVTQRFRRQIRSGELRFLFAHDGEEALETLAAEPDVELVLSDINMPRMDGLTLLARLGEADDDRRAVIISAYGDMENIRAAMNCGAFDFLTKPIAFEDLDAIIAKTLRHVQRYRQMRRGKIEAERARTALARYFSPNLADQLASNPRFMELGGERRVGTFLFTDLANFTPLVEASDPAHVVQLVNSYLDGVTQVIFAHEGTVVKIIGDAVYAMFGAPTEQADHARRAVDCALAIDAFARDFEAERHAAGVPLGMTRIGVNTGQAIIGNFGGDLFFDYTAHGDAINIASRLESVNKQLGTRLCVSATTVAEVEGFRGRPVGELVLKGREQPLMAYEPLTEAEFERPQTAAYQAAFDKLAGGDALGARQAFAGLVGLYGDDPLALYHLQRLLAGETGVRIDLPDK